MKKVLIICYSFPPFPGIGGRRWAKFAKYLRRNGCYVHIIASKNPFKEISQWQKDVENIEVTYLASNYPSVLIKTSHSGILDSVNYHASLLFVKLFCRGNYYDRSLFWRRQLIKKASEVIKKQNILNVIASGPPFHTLYHCSELKERFPSINFMADFRDLWTTDLSISGLSQMSPKRRDIEKMMETKVIKKADIVLTVSDKMNAHFKSINPKVDCHTLINGYDEMDFQKISNGQVSYKNNKKIRLVFTGTIYDGLENSFISLIEALKRLKKERPDFYNLFSFNFYGLAPKTIKEIINSQQVDAIKLNEPISLNEVYVKINEADLCMLFLAESYTFSLSTKFYEYISQKKKIVLFSSKGETSEFIEKNKLGYWINPESSYEGLIKIVEHYNQGILNIWESHIDVSQYSVEQISKKLLELLK